LPVLSKGPAIYLTRELLKHVEARFNLIASGIQAYLPHLGVEQVNDSVNGL
jgi:hypothetical protein